MLTGAAIGFGVIALLLFLGWARRNRDRLPFGGGERAATGLVLGLAPGRPVVATFKATATRLLPRPSRLRV